MQAPQHERGGEEHDQEGENQNGGLVANPPVVHERMTLSDYDINLALNIKSAIAGTDHVDPVSDFMCAQLALFDGDDTEAAVERAYHSQCFREEYRVLDTFADGVKTFAAYMKLMPGFHLSFANDMTVGQNVMIFDNTKFQCSRIRNNEENMRIMMAGTYYNMVLFCPNFSAIQSGAIVVAECGGYDWKADMDLNTTKKVWSEIGSVYPVSFHRMKFYRNNTMLNIMASMARPFLPQKWRNNIEFGCEFEHRLDEVYLLPSLEASNLRLLVRAEAMLRERYENEATFRLP